MARADYSNTGNGTATAGGYNSALPFLSPPCIIKPSIILWNVNPL